MAGADRSVQDQWVARVLGVAIGGGGSGLDLPSFRARWTEAVSAWQDAVEQVDKQMAALGAVLRKTDDPWLQRIAELGLPAVTGNHKVPMMAACMDVGRAGPEALPAATAAARKAITAFAQHLATNPQVAGCDTNPFKVKVSIRTTLGPALKALNDTLRQRAA
jgi:hypothetical protein